MQSLPKQSVATYTKWVGDEETPTNAKKRAGVIVRNGLTSFNVLAAYYNITTPTTMRFVRHNFEIVRAPLIFSGNSIEQAIRHFRC